MKVSVLYREPKLLKAPLPDARAARPRVSVLYREPKLLKERFIDIDLPAVETFQCSTVSRNC